MIGIWHVVVSVVVVAGFMMAYSALATARGQRDAILSTQRAVRSLHTHARTHDDQIGKLAEGLARVDPQGTKPTITLERPTDEALAAAARARAASEHRQAQRPAEAIDAQIAEIAGGPRSPRDTRGDRSGFPPVDGHDPDKLTAALAEVQRDRAHAALPAASPSGAAGPSEGEILEAFDDWQAKGGTADQLEPLLVSLRTIVERTPEGTQRAQLVLLARHFEGRALVVRRAEEAAEVARRVADHQLPERGPAAEGEGDRLPDERTRVAEIDPASLAAALHATPPPTEPPPSTQPSASRPRRAVLWRGVSLGPPSAPPAQEPSEDSADEDTHVYDARVRFREATLVSFGIHPDRVDRQATAPPSKPANDAPSGRDTASVPPPTPSPIDSRVRTRWLGLVAEDQAAGTLTQHCHGPRCLQEGHAFDACSCMCRGCERIAKLLDRAKREVR